MSEVDFSKQQLRCFAEMHGALLNVRLSCSISYAVNPKMMAGLGSRRNPAYPDLLLVSFS